MKNYFKLDKSHKIVQTIYYCKLLFSIFISNKIWLDVQLSHPHFHSEIFLIRPLSFYIEKQRFESAETCINFLEPRYNTGVRTKRIPWKIAITCIVWCFRRIRENVCKSKTSCSRSPFLDPVAESSTDRSNSTL